MNETRHRVGIMGGTFDPIHISHLILAEAAYEQLNLEYVLFLPSGNPPHKKERPGGASDRDRLEMVRLAISDNPHFVLDEEEMKREGFTYTYETLQNLRTLHPDTDYFFIVGADSLMAFHTWMHPERITSSCILVAAVRDQINRTEILSKIDQLRVHYHADIRLLDTPDLEISSSHLRSMCRSGQSVRYYVPDQVFHYIKTNGLYKEEISLDGTL